MKITGYVTIVDFSHLIHLCHATALYEEGDVTKITIDRVVGKLTTVKRELNKLNIRGYDLVFVEDRPAVRKLNLLPTYRNKRGGLDEQKKAVKEYLLQNGKKSRFCFSEGNEADDVISTICRMVVEQDGLHAIVVTSDKDLWQLLGSRVSIFNPIKKEMVTPELVEKQFRCGPTHIPLVKALWGDYGDSVPNVVPRTQKHLLPAVLQSDGSLSSFFRTIDDEYRWYLKPEVFNVLVEKKPDIDINYQLVKLDERCELVWE